MIVDAQDQGTGTEGDPVPGHVIETIGDDLAQDLVEGVVQDHEIVKSEDDLAPGHVTGTVDLVPGLLTAGEDLVLMNEELIQGHLIMMMNEEGLIHIQM